MAVTDQLSAVASTAIQEGRYTLNRVWRSEATAATPVTPTNLSNIISFEVGEPSFNENEYFMQGAGDDRLTLRRTYKWPITIAIYKGKTGTVLETLLGLTWSTAGTAGIPLKDNTTLPSVHWEAICRDADNSTHLHSIVVQDLILNLPGFPNPMDYTDNTISGYTYYPPILLCSGAEMVYDIHSGDGSTTDFAASSTPISLVTATNHDDFYIDEAVFVKEKSTTASAGTRQTSGWSYAGGNFTKTSAPTVSYEIQIFYAKTT